MEKKRTPTSEEITKACKEQYTKTGAVLPPQYCLACQKCALGAVVKFIGEDP